MTGDDFRQSLTAAKPPAELTLALLGLWWDSWARFQSPLASRGRRFVEGELPTIVSVIEESLDFTGGREYGRRRGNGAIRCD
jgi:hypothetical protein